LLFGILALQMNFIGRDDLIAAVSTWVLDKSRSLETILSEKGSLNVECRELLVALVQKHLEQHDNNTEKAWQPSVRLALFAKTCKSWTMPTLMPVCCASR